MQFTSQTGNITVVQLKLEIQACISQITFDARKNMIRNFELSKNHFMVKTANIIEHNLPSLVSVLKSR